MEQLLNSLDHDISEEQTCGLYRNQPLTTTRLTVCHIASGDAWGGAEVQVATLVDALAKRTHVDVCAIVLNEGRLAQELQACGIVVKVISQNEKSFLDIVGEAHEFLRGRNMQIVHSHRYKENLLAAILALRNPNLQLVRTQHGWPEASRGLAGVKQWAAYALDRLTARYSADRVIGVSRHLNDYFRRYLDPQKVVTIRNGVNLDHVRSTFTRREAKERLALSGNDLVVGFAGRLERVKRLDLFAAAARELATRIPNVKFVIAGSGREEQELRRTVRESGLIEKTLLLGHCENSYDVLRAMDLLLITSDHEGLPMVMLESMALGTVVVSRPVGGIPEVLSHDETGILLKSTDARAIAEVCSELLLDAQRRSRVADAARELVARQYSHEHNCDQVISLYHSLRKKAVEKNPAASTCAVPVIEPPALKKI